MTPKVRFAPSPTGRIHIGNARTALMNWLFAKHRGGTFVLRFDDTDQERSRQEYADSIEVDLNWLGIHPDEVARQSQRFPLYAAAAEKLKALGRLYPCYESEDELDRRRKRRAARGLPPVYDRAALALTADEMAALEAEGRKPHWRFKLDHRVVAWRDLVRGECHVDCASLSDPVLVRADGTYLYTLPSVVDDVDMAMTHIIRGEDHVTNTAVQIQLFELLGTTVPQFAHHNLLTNASGEGLSKRMGHLSLASLREEGLEAMAAASLAVLVGSSEAVRPIASLAALAPLVDLGRLSRAPARFDEAELHHLNARLLHDADFASVKDRLQALGLAADEAFWLAVRGNLASLKDALVWWQVVKGPQAPVATDATLLAAAVTLLPQEPWDQTTWGAWTAAIKAETGLSGRNLFMPLRLALTGHEHGPELKALLPLIGHDRALRRLKGETA
ncbi:MAG: glutamate--tRNA ligase [Hyphomicrobiales bacterium]|nr:glutamate--tRNA ligase [Hyphomicrobiales bacterium]